MFLPFSLNVHSFYSLNFVSLITLSLNNEMLPTVSAPKTGMWEILYVDIFRGSRGSKFRWRALLDTCWRRSVSSHRGHQLTSKSVSRLAQSCWGQSMSFMSLMQPTDWWEIKKSLSAYRAATLLLTPILIVPIMYCMMHVCAYIQFSFIDTVPVHNSHPKVLHTAR